MLIKLLFIIFLCVNTAVFAIKPVKILTTIKPLYNLTAAIIEQTPHNNLSLLLTKNTSPHHYALKFSDIKAINQANLIIWIGPDLEIFLDKLFTEPQLNNKLLTVQSLADINKLPADNNHSQLDEHLWLDPNNAIVIVNNITNKLITLNPDYKTKYLSNKQKFINKLTNTNKLINHKFNNIKNYNYLVFHNAYQYYTKFYGLNTPFVIHNHPELPLSAKKMLAISNIINNNKINCLFKEPQFTNIKIINFLQDKHPNLMISTLDPLGDDSDLGPEGYINLLTNLTDNLTSCLMSAH